MKAVKYILVFFVIIVLLNVLGGKAMNHFFNQTRSGESGGKINCYLNSNPNPEILIMGSSRAAGNIDPKLFTNSAFNIAHNGMYDVFQLNLLNILIEQKKKPEIILYHIDLTHFDEDADMVSMEQTSVEGIKLFYNRSPFVKNFVDSIGLKNKAKYVFDLYPYNGRAVNIFFHFLRTKRTDPTVLCHNGYLPLPVTKRDSLNTLKKYQKSMLREKSVTKLNVEKLDVIKQIEALAEMHDIKLVFFRSPTFRYDISRSGESTFVFQKQVNSPFIDFMQDPLPELRHAKYWKDMSHVNGDGANIQTHALISKLNELGFEL